MTFFVNFVNMSIMKTKKKIVEKRKVERRERILTAARWCFLNFGFSKTSLEDIARRADLSRTLLYRVFKNKEDIFTAVFTDWMLSRHPAAKQAATAPGSNFDRLFNVCKLLVIEPWSDMVKSPMGGKIFDAAERVDPSIQAQHQNMAMDCVTTVLGNKRAAEVFILALHGLLMDQPAVSELEGRIQILVEHFVGPVKESPK